MSVIRERFMGDACREPWQLIFLAESVRTTTEPACRGGACPSDERGQKIVYYGGGRGGGKKFKQSKGAKT